MSALLAQTRAELVLTLRRGESLLLILGIPLLLLGFFSIGRHPARRANFSDPIDFLFPGILALAVMSTGMVQLAIGTAFERQYGVLKRLGITPLGRPRLLTAKTLSIVAIEVVQIVLLLALALALGWDQYVRIGAFIGVVLGTIAFAGLGLLMAGQLKGEVTLAAANGLYLILLLLGGMVVPLSELPTGSAPHRRAAAVRGTDAGAGRNAERRPCRARSRVDRAAGVGGRRAPRGREDLPLGVSNGDEQIWLRFGVSDRQSTVWSSFRRRGRMEA